MVLLSDLLNTRATVHAAVVTSVAANLDTVTISYKDFPPPLICSLDHQK